MILLLSCPKCRTSLQVDAALAGKQDECTNCGQWFVVGQAGAELPVVEPEGVLVAAGGDHASKMVKSMERPTLAGEATRLKKGLEAEGLGRFVKGELPPGASFQRRKCAACGSPMVVSHGVNHILDSLLPLGSTVYWECGRCGKEIKVQSPWRLFLIVLATPLLAVWWFLFTESTRSHDENAAWWQKAAENLAPHDSKGTFWYILFLLLFALAPLALIRELIVRLRYPRLL